MNGPIETHVRTGRFINRKSTPGLCDLAFMIEPRCGRSDSGFQSAGILSTLLCFKVHTVVFPSGGAA